MSGAHMNLRLGPATYAVSVAVTGGQLVMPDGTTGLVKPATAGAKTVVGVALSDGEPSGSTPTSPLNLGWAQPEIAVAYGPADVDLTYTGAAAFGELLVADANGAVKAYTAASDTYDAIVARCTEPAGMAAAGVGRARLLI